MDNDEILRRQQEGFALRNKLGDMEYRKIKAKRRRDYYDKMQADAKEALGEKYKQPVQNPIRVAKEKPRTAMVGIIVVDDGGEHVFMWQAPNLKGTMMPSKQNMNGYKEAVFESLQKAFGKLTEAGK